MVMQCVMQPLWLHHAALGLEVRRRVRTGRYAATGAYERATFWLLVATYASYQGQNKPQTVPKADVECKSHARPVNTTISLFRQKILLMRSHKDTKFPQSVSTET